MWDFTTSPFEFGVVSEAESRGKRAVFVGHWQNDSQLGGIERMAAWWVAVALTISIVATLWQDVVEEAYMVRSWKERGVGVLIQVFRTKCSTGTSLPVGAKVKQVGMIRSARAQASTTSFGSLTLFWLLLVSQKRVPSTSAGS